MTIELEGIDPAALGALSAVDLALFWARRGCPVGPADPNFMKPWMGSEWQRKATTDEAQIRQWWIDKPTARVGIKTGLACGCGCTTGPDVIDFDTGWDDTAKAFKPGVEQRRKLVDAGVLDGTKAMRLQTPTTTETGRGEHWWFEGTDQPNKQNIDAVWAIDLRAHHGWVLAPGNPGYEIKNMPWGGLGKISWEQISDCPGLAQRPGRPTTPLAGPPATRTALPGMHAPPAAPASPVGYRSPKLVAPGSRFDDPVGEESPLDWVSRTHDIEDMLRSAGWQFVNETGDRRHYRRPGKDQDVSGNVATMADGRRVFYNFSSSVGIPTDRAVSGGQLYAWLFHGGDMRAAASDIRRTLMPSRYPAGPPANSGAAGVPAAAAATQKTGAALASATQAEPPDPVRQFWSRRPELREIWWQSQLAGVSPWAVLGVCLAQVAARVGPHVQLPPPGGVGTPGSLNLLVAISGNSGTGKGLASGVARGFFGAPNPPQRKPGTGQGIAAIFTEQTKEGPVQTNDTAILNVSEITGLGAHADMQGSTLVSTLLEIYMGEELGEHYANKEKRRPVREGAYRLALTAGVQPGNSHIILDHAESGLPQRFIWTPAFWPDAVIPESSLVPPAPGPELRVWRSWSRLLPGSMDDSLMATGWSASDAGSGLERPSKKKDDEAVPVKDLVLVTLAPAVKREVDRDRQRRLNVLRKRQQDGEDDPGDPDSHLLFARLKVASHMAFWLDGTTTIGDDVWDLSRWVIWVSNDTRIRAAARLNEKAREKTSGRAMAQVAVTQIVQEETDRKRNAAYIGACDRAMHLVTTAGGWVPVRAVTQRMSSKERGRYRDAGIELPDVLNDLVLAGKLQVREIEKSGNTTHEWAPK